MLAMNGHECFPLLVSMYILFHLTKGRLSNVATDTWQIQWPC